MNLRRGLFLLPFLAAMPLVNCGDDDSPLSPAPGADGGGGNGDGGTIIEEVDKPLVAATKVDLLFAIDNSQSMGTKQALLAAAVNRVLRRITETTDHGPVDLHVGVVASSLGTLGGDVCPDTNVRANLRGHLVNANEKGEVVAGAEAGFASFQPGGDFAKLEETTKNLITSVGQNGCGFEAQLESVYRFLVQPDPPSAAALDPSSQKVVFGPIDDELLAQRKAFLRPDSAVAIVMLTDEDDSMVDPMALGGLGWAFTSRSFPGSKVSRGTAARGTTAPRGTSVCETDPGSPDCTSCRVCNQDPACKAKQDPSCAKSGAPGTSGEGYDGYFSVLEDDLNIRFHRMKQRYGVDPQFPIDRYVRGLSYRKVPKRDTEHDAAGNYVHAETCTNPLFAASLPASGQEETCNLPEGSRSRRLIMFQLLGGLPPALGGASPNWAALVGRAPERYDYAGIDPHMVQSPAPRAGIAGDASAPRGDNGADPVHGREWDTNDKDLQYACTIALPREVDCRLAGEGCDCFDDPAGGQPATNVPLCKEDGSAVQTRGKAYPSLREIRLAKALGERGLVASICAFDPSTSDDPILDGLATKLTSVLAK